MSKTKKHTEAVIRVNVIGADTKARRNCCPQTIGQYLNFHFEIHFNDYYSTYEAYEVSNNGSTMVCACKELGEAFDELKYHVETRADGIVAF